MNLTIILGLIAATLTAISFIPQAIKTIKSKRTKDISLGMYLLSTIGMSLWLIYGMIIKDLPLILANIVTVSLALTILIFKIKYK
ncbi:MAG: SemiSWEET transporter [Nanoarchaeota archaeon]|nr:SemiSWEET transporter [Nanoarchaeota archaeon]